MRCADCVRNAPNNFGDGWCLLLRRAVSDDWFCANFEGKCGKGIILRLREFAETTEGRCDIAESVGLDCATFKHCRICTKRVLSKIADMIEEEYHGQ